MGTWDIPVGIVVYYPDSICISRIKQLAWSGVPTWIFDNTPNGSQNLISEFKNEKLNIIGDGVNWGLGSALHKLMKSMHHNGFKEAIYFDQDTHFTLKTIEWIQNWRKAHNQSNFEEDVLINFAGNTVPLKFENAKSTEEILLINSGSLFVLDTLNKIGWHNSSIFLECVDYEICGRIRNRGYKSKKVTGCIDIDHEIYQPMREFSLGSKKLKYRLYPVNRTVNFVKGLFYWGIYYGIKGDIVFFYLCVRNILTHLLNQGIYSVLHLTQIIAKKS